jgi:hypothetical protein
VVGVAAPAQRGAAGRRRAGAEQQRQQQQHQSRLQLSGGRSAVGCRSSSHWCCHCDSSDSGSSDANAGDVLLLAAAVDIARLVLLLAAAVGVAAARVFAIRAAAVDAAVCTARVGVEGKGAAVPCQAAAAAVVLWLQGSRRFSWALGPQNSSRGLQDLQGFRGYTGCGNSSSSSSFLQLQWGQ